MLRFAAGLLAAVSCLASVVTVRTVERTDVKNTSGPPYERIVARAYFAVDPADPANSNITDLKLTKGVVEFSADIVVLEPRDPKQGNGTALVDIPNRGGETYGTFQREDQFLFEQGFTIVDV